MIINNHGCSVLNGTHPTSHSKGSPNIFYCAKCSLEQKKRLGNTNLKKFTSHQLLMAQLCRPVTRAGQEEQPSWVKLSSGAKYFVCGPYPQTCSLTLFLARNGRAIKKDKSLIAD